MTSELLYNLLRFGSLILIWVLIGSAILVLKRDIVAVSPKLALRSKKASSSPAPASKEASKRTPRYLAFISGPLENKRIPLKISPIILGRAPDCTIPLQDTYASGHHLRLYRTDGQWFVEDLNSTNGTLLNGTPLQAPHPVLIGQRIQIGQTTMELTR